MTKKEVFDKILETAAFVCSVDRNEIIDGCKRESVVAARAVVVFWLDKAGFRTDDILDMVQRDNPESINKIKRTFEERWKDWVFREMVRETGCRLEEIAKTINHDFDPHVPLDRMRKICGR